jgi:hypothetical protein
MSVLCWNTDSSIYWKHFANSCQSHLLLIFTLSALCSFNLCAHQCGLIIQIITIWAIRSIKLVLIITYNSFPSARRGAPLLLVYIKATAADLRGPGPSGFPGPAYTVTRQRGVHGSGRRTGSRRGRDRGSRRAARGSMSRRVITSIPFRR